MPDGAKSGGAEGLHEAVGMGPSVERQTESIGGKHAVHLSECGL